MVGVSGRDESVGFVFVITLDIVSSSRSSTRRIVGGIHIASRRKFVRVGDGLDVRTWRSLQS